MRQPTRSLDNRSADFLLRQAHLERVRGRHPEALRALGALLDLDPQNAEALAIKDAVERDVAGCEAERRAAKRLRDRHAAVVCRVAAAALLFGAFLLFGEFTDRQVVAEPMLFGLRRAYWYIVGALALAAAAGGVWLLKSRWEPDWTDLDKPDPEGRYGYGWWHWWWW